MHIPIYLTLYLWLLLVFLPLHSVAQTPDFRKESKPVWEFGLGGGHFRGFDYPASSDPNNQTLALPYIIYRGPLLRLTSGRLQAVAFEDPRWKLDLSLGASFSANSEGNSARASMPDLDFLFEIGPRLEYRLMNHSWSDGSTSKLSWETYLRAVFSTDFSDIAARGFRFSSRLRYRHNKVAGFPVDFFARLGPIWASSRLNDYFYAVPPAFETESRPSFKASGGYLGTELFYGFAIYLKKNFRLILGSVEGFYDGASNEESPLFEVKQSRAYLFGFVWSLKQSKERIEVLEDD